jgi:hypothetical protein
MEYPNQRRLWTAIGFALFLMIAEAPGQTMAAEEFKTIIIKPGDSISYISFKLYKKFNRQISEALLASNPKLKNINLVYVGQKLRFPRHSAIEKGTYQTSIKATPEVPPQKGVEPQKEIPPPPPLPETIPEKSDGMTAYITYLKGVVSIHRKGMPDRQPAEINLELYQGDRIHVDKASMVELITEGNSILRLGENSDLTITRLEKKPKQKARKTNFSLALGRLWNKARKLVNPKSEYIVNTPTALSGVRGTVYGIDVLPNQDTRFKTYSGSINVWNPAAAAAMSTSSGGNLVEPHAVAGPNAVAGPHPVNREEWTNIILKKHQELLVTKNGAATQQAFDPQKDRQDSWVEFNLQRDQDFEGQTPWF